MKNPTTHVRATAMPSITHIIYDVDGLLLDTEPFYTQVSKKIAGRYGKTFDWSVKSRMIGKQSRDSAEIFTKALDLPLSPLQYLAERSALLEELFPSAQPLPGAEAITHHFSEHRIPQALATSSDSRHFELKTSRHRDWFALFQCIVLGDDPAVAQGKPAPDIFLVAAQRLGAAPARCLVFEDSPAGVEAARAAGMSVVAVPDPHMDRRVYQGADRIIDRLDHFDPEEWQLPAYPEQSLRA
jgi:pseudouridine-5'-monophosphatase